MFIDTTSHSGKERKFQYEDIESLLKMFVQYCYTDKIQMRE